MTALFIGFWGLVGAGISLCHGGQFLTSLPKVLKNIIWALPFGLCSFFAFAPSYDLIISTSIAVAAFAFCLAGKASGHGRVWQAHLPLQTYIDAEKLELPILFLIGRIPDYWYKNFAMGIIGFAAVSGAAASIGYINIGAGLLIALGGFLGKPLSYVIGYSQTKVEGNIIGEALTGLFAFGALAGAYVLTGV